MLKHPRINRIQFTIEYSLNYPDPFNDFRQIYER